MENCAKEATYLIAVATVGVYLLAFHPNKNKEYFIKYLTDAGYIQATLDKRNTIQYRDLGGWHSLTSAHLSLPSSQRG